MPKNVRNFWLEISIDGRKTMVETGPVSDDGGFSCVVYMRDNGDIVRGCTLTGIADRQGKLTLFLNSESIRITDR